MEQQHNLVYYAVTTRSQCVMACTLPEFYRNVSLGLGMLLQVPPFDQLKMCNRYCNIAGRVHLDPVD